MYEHTGHANSPWPEHKNPFPPTPPTWPGSKHRTLQLVYDPECHTVALPRWAKRVLHQTINRKRASKQPTENASKRKVVHKKCIPPRHLTKWQLEETETWRREAGKGGIFSLILQNAPPPPSAGLLQGTPRWGFLPYTNPLTFLWLVLIAWRQSREEKKKRNMRGRVHRISGCTII